MAAPMLRKLQGVFVNTLQSLNNIKYFSCGQVLQGDRGAYRGKKEKTHLMIRSDGQFAHHNEILLIQKGLHFYPGENVGIDARNRLYALCDGTVVITCETLNPYPDSPLYKYVQRGYVVKKKFLNLIPTPLHGKFKLVSEV